MSATHVTRDLTTDESETLVRRLSIALGPTQAEHALRVIGESGHGIFAVESGIVAIVGE